ncbi:MAG: hypothetical protein KatS3mg129_2883 [Leptospiraceae bacterium]|nr:MAG: hypothetical protein KatS3mg129_2883 [Leptospiraceae bacterium]
MSLLSELVMRYDIQLEEALRELIQRGIPVNLFLKQGGMDDLLKDFINKLQQQIQDLQNQYDIRSGIQETEKDITKHYKEIEKKLINFPNMLNKLKEAIENRSFDKLNQFKWEIFKNPSLEKKLSHRELNQLIKDIEDLNLLLEGLKKYHFKGKEQLNRKESVELVLALQDLEQLIENLKNSLENGDVYNFDLEALSKYLGPESYQEFIKRREEIFKQLTELLEKQGKIIRNEEGDIELSPETIKKIGRKSLEEIFKHLRSDDTGGALYTKEEGDGEQVTPITREYQPGDNLSNLDITNSLINAFIRTGKPKPGFRDLEVFKSRGMAKSSIVILLDMSGSMFRVDRFYYAKKMILALEALIREEYKEDTLHIVGFGTFAKIFSIAEIPKLQPYPVTLFDPFIRLRFDLSKRKPLDYRGIPEYFTNLQRGLALSRKLLGSKQTKNKQIILITDGVPTAHIEGSVLHINYPPSPADFDFALKEAIMCKEEDIILNTFLLTNEWNFNFFEGRSFIHDFAKVTKGRIFYPHPSELGKFVLADFIEEKRKLIS